jgi:hypothetical protein
MLRAHVKPPLRPDTFTGKMDGVLLHPVAGTVILMLILFLMFQAVFSWATPVMDAIDASFVWLGQAVAAYVPDGLLRSFPGRWPDRRGRQCGGFPAANPDPVLLYHPAGRFRLYGARRLP